MHSKFKELLHQYKRDVFLLEHHQKDAVEVTKECMELCEDVLAQKYHYHFHKLPDANRAEIINMINNYTREAILPPVVEKLAERQVLLEHRLLAMQTLLTNMLEELSVPTEHVR
ncbi:MAG: hypothetical protein WD226_01840 [Planctomycetota bacterium]